MTTKCTNLAIFTLFPSFLAIENLTFSWIKKKLISHFGKITPVKKGWGGRFQDTLP
jgi:hypothetical protein